MPLSFTGPDSFYSAGEETWWASVDKALKGTSRQRLYGNTEDGLEIAPLYERRTDVPARALRSAVGDWGVVQRVDIPDPEAANRQILRDLENGAGGLELVFPGALACHGGGIAAGDLAAFETLLKNVQLDLISLRIDAGPVNAEVLALVMAVARKNGIDPAVLDVTCASDPYGWLAARGASAGEPETAVNRIRELADSLSDLGNPARVVAADGEVWHNAGATPAQELALVLASATAYLRLLEGTKLAPDDWAGRISMKLVADADQFGTIAKARAIRALWSSVLDGAGLAQAPASLHVTTSNRMLTRRDPWVNLLRNTVAVFAAGVGGADSICVLPHTLAVGLPDGFARRLARNTQSILLEESNLAKVLDPAAGSGAIEDRTEKLCGAAWAFFQEIEAAGGLPRALEQGLVQDRIEAARSDLAQNVASRKRPITGVSEFPNLTETEVDVLPGDWSENAGLSAQLTDLPSAGTGEWFPALLQAALDGKPLLRTVDVESNAPGIAALKLLSSGRIAEPFEELRSRAETLEAGAPKVFLASLGTLAQFTARATWTANAFAAGGLQAVGPAVYGSLEELVSAFTESGAMLACIVSSDEVYESQAEDAARALKEAGARALYLAGKPGERETILRDAGVDTFLFAGCDLLGLLSEAHGRLQGAGGAEKSEQEIRK
ncbi:methylmalonyl-CoA mutase family protein [Roseibium sp.]|uniref:methylmalonyl-CoA mutase family protein n=1 Tax=Roseibium sp. TaxID=1936156 RepID=UPI003D0A3398